MKVKYIDKRHWRRIVEREYAEVKVNNNKFKGIIGLVTMKKVKEPLEVTVVGKNIIVADDNYQWLQILPEKKRYQTTKILLTTIAKVVLLYLASATFLMIKNLIKPLLPS